MTPLKERAIEELQRKSIPIEELNKTDDRLLLYVDELKAYPERHNVYEILALSRFLGFFEKYDWRQSEVQKFVAFYEFLKFPSKQGNERFKLTPVQVFQFASIKGFFHRGTNRRLTREALLFVPRKYSKTTSVASLAIEDLLFGDNNAQCFVGANSYDQAQNCFRVIKSVLKEIDPKMRRFKINRETVYNLNKGRSSFAKCLSSRADKLDGLNASTIILDEYSQSESADLRNVLTSSMGIRENPLTIVITTASDKFDTPFTEMLESYKAILRGEAENDSIFAHIFQPDEGDDEGAPLTWHKVNPHIGVTVREDFYEAEWKKAQTSSHDMKAFRNKLLNVFAQDERRTWITHKQIEDLYVPQGLVEDFRGCRCVTAVDLSVVDDFSAVTYMLYKPRRRVEGRALPVPFHSVTEYYFPEGRLAQHPNRELYTRWVEAGHLKLLGGDVIDFRAIVNDILSKEYRNLGVGYDRYKAQEFIKMLELAPGVGAEYLYEVPQTYGAFTSPVESMELMIYRGQISFARNPITAYCFGNAVIDEDKLENRKPIKREQSGKIDGCVTNVMACWMLQNLRVSL